mgnify:CR=1 FL=1
MTYRLGEQQCGNLEVSTKREWLLTNGIGGYAMGTPSGINTRRYHGHLIAAIHPPADRMVLLAAMDAFIQGDAHPVGVSANQYPGAIFPEGQHYLKEFSVGKSAKWHYVASHLELEKCLYLHRGVNACTLRYRNVGKAPFLLTLRPFVCHKPHHENFIEQAGYPEQTQFLKGRTVIEHHGVALHCLHPEAQRVPVEGWYYRFEHQREAERGLDPRDDLYCPFELKYELLPGEEASLAFGDHESIELQSIPEDATASSPGLLPLLVSAADPLIVETQNRSSIIAGYPWFTDWGRDTMISLPGLLILTGRSNQAKKVLLDYAAQCRDGLIPNRFVESGETPDYNTVDATLWFVNAVFKVLSYEWDADFARAVGGTLSEIFVRHTEGTLFGIHVDPADGLITQGEPGVQLTWMDAKIGDWVVTPRHGKPVEINGLWISALRAMEWIFGMLGQSTELFVAAAEKAEKSFHEKFWHEVRGHYLDTVDPADASLRPNQLIAMALPFGPATGEQAERALDVISRKLYTPRGMRTLAPDEPGYIGRYEGSMRDRDAAYHQGTAWPWLLGSYATALVRVKGDRLEAKRVLREIKQMVQEYGMNGIAEVYDGDGPQRPGGCPWQAWSVGEILRAWVEDVGGD